jgi:ParB-like chromosome segregation protein Spo0J
MALPYCHSHYFCLENGYELVRVGLLVPTKERQQRSVRKARSRMQRAASGEIPRRPPILVRARDDGRYDILDGHATVAVARDVGWPDVPAEMG